MEQRKRPQTPDDPLSCDKRSKPTHDANITSTPDSSEEESDYESADADLPLDRLADMAIEGVLARPLDALLASRVNPDILTARGIKDDGSRLLPRVFLRHQLYVAPPDAPPVDFTAVDCDVERLCNSGHLVQLTLGAKGQADDDDTALMRASDYATLVRRAANDADATDSELFDRLMEFISAGGFVSCRVDRRLLDRQLRVDDAQITRLISAGLLVTIDATTFALSAPGLGKLAVQLRHGRRELLLWLRRRRYQEAPLGTVMEKKLQRASLINKDYLLADLLGCGHVERRKVGGHWHIHLTAQGLQDLATL